IFSSGAFLCGLFSPHNTIKKDSGSQTRLGPLLITADVFLLCSFGLNYPSTSSGERKVQGIRRPADCRANAREDSTNLYVGFLSAVEGRRPRCVICGATGGAAFSLIMFIIILG
ncbi:MAG TPA: hypothetical protein VJ184_11320, partial [Chryseolinea sp.]|nr:hypothetical protein [Chryseolinea sp.]